jgi:lysophospholipase
MAPGDPLQLYPHAGNHLPHNAEVCEITTADGIRLRAMTAGTAGSKGTVVVLNGRTDFLERYFETAEDLIARGFVFVSFDWRGQGGSQRLLKDRMRGYVTSFRKYDKDLEAVMTELVVRKCPAPYFALAHSTGGNVLLRSLREPTLFSRAVVTSPLLDFIYRPWPRKIAKVLAWVFVLSGFGWMYLPGRKRGPLLRKEFDGNPLTSDPGRWDRDITTTEKFPQLCVGGPTFSWFRAALSSVATLKSWSRSRLISCPVLIVAPSREHVVDPKAARDFSERVPGVSFVQISGSLHEILMEKDRYRQEFWAAFDSFLTDSG